MSGLRAHLQWQPISSHMFLFPFVILPLRCLFYSTNDQYKFVLLLVSVTHFICSSWKFAFIYEHKCFLWLKVGMIGIHGLYLQPQHFRSHEELLWMSLLKRLTEWCCASINRMVMGSVKSGFDGKLVFLKKQCCYTVLKRLATWNNRTLFHEFLHLFGIFDCGGYEKWCSSTQNF